MNTESIKLKTSEKGSEERFISSYRKHPDKPLRVLLDLYKGQYHMFMISSFFYLIKHSPALISPLLLANVINGVLSSDYDTAVRTVLLNSGIWLLLLCIHLPANYMYTKYKSKVIRETEAGLRAALIRKLSQLSLPGYVAQQTGKLQSKIMRDVEAIETLSSQLFQNLINITMNMVITLSITAAKNRTILLFFILVAPIASLTVIRYRTRIQKANREFRLEMEETSGKVMEMVEMIPAIRAHALEETEKEKIVHQLEETAEKGYRLDVIQSNFGAVGWVVFQVFQALCLCFTGFMALKGRILVGDITFYQSSFTTVVNQFTSVINLLPIITKGLESVTSVGEILINDDVENNEGKEKINSLKGEYSFSHVNYSYPGSEHETLKDFTLHVPAGKTVAVVGESGAGKSTLISMIIGFMLPESGQLTIDGRDISQIDLKSYRRFISVVPQTPLLFNGTLRENIAFGMPDITDEQVEKAVEAADLTDLVSRLPEGLNSHLEEHGGNLSGGQKQRIAIARAVIRDPKVILLDEATSALDVVSEYQIQKTLTRLLKDRTAFIVAHRLSTIRNADWLVVMENGTPVEQGTYEQLMEKKGVFYHMESMQTSIRL